MDFVQKVSKLIGETESYAKTILIYLPSGLGPLRNKVVPTFFHCKLPMSICLRFRWWAWHAWNGIEWGLVSQWSQAFQGNKVDITEQVNITVLEGPYCQLVLYILFCSNEEQWRQLLGLRGKVSGGNSWSNISCDAFLYDITGKLLFGFLHLPACVNMV